MRRNGKERKEKPEKGCQGGGPGGEAGGSENHGEGVKRREETGRSRGGEGSPFPLRKGPLPEQPV